MKWNLNGSPSPDWMEKFNSALDKKLSTYNGGTLQNMGSDNPTTPKGN